MTDIAHEYNRRFDKFLKKIADNLQEYIRGCLTEIKNIDRITSRAKDPSRFAEKARRKDENGKMKYKKPLTEIQDQLGVRVIVFYQDDVSKIDEAISRYLKSIEKKELIPESQWAFGYFGYHSVLSLPSDVIPEGIESSEVPQFFELQIKTLFQHAWSEANHDLGYHSSKPLSEDQERRLAYTAAQAWGADRMFNELYNELKN